MKTRVNVVFYLVLFTLMSFLFFACPNKHEEKKDGQIKEWMVSFASENVIHGVVVAKTKNGVDIVSATKVKEGSKIILQAIPTDFYEFEGWQINNEMLEGTEKELELEVKKDISIIAKFRLKTNKPPLSETEVKIFMVNGIGRNSIQLSTFDSEFESHLSDGTNPLFLVDGDDFEIKAGWWPRPGEVSLIGNVSFMLDGKDVKRLALAEEEESGYIKKFTAHYSGTLKDEDEHNVSVEVEPKDASTYNPCVYTFKIKKSGLKVRVPGVRFYVNNESHKQGEKIKIDAATATLSIQTYLDNIKDVEIGSKDDMVKVEVKLLNASSNLYEAKRTVTLPQDAHKEFIIRANPKDEIKYRSSEYACKIVGIGVAKNNAKFVHINVNGDEKPDVVSNITFYDNKPRGFIDLYGAVNAQIIARTESARAKVFCKILDDKGNAIAMEGEASSDAKEMQNDGSGTHTINVKFFPNKPTNFYAWVVAEDGSTKDDEKGVYSYTYNEIMAKWDKDLNKTKGKKFANTVYDKIIIPKADFDSWQLSNGKKEMVVAFRIFKEGLEDCPNYSVFKGQINPPRPTYQGDIEKLDIQHIYQWYKTIIDITELKEDTPYEIVFPIAEEGALCFQYKIKIELK